MSKSALTVLDQVTEVSQLVLQIGCFDLLNLVHLLFMQWSETLPHRMFEMVGNLVNDEVI